MKTSTRHLLGGLAVAAVLLLGQGGSVIAASPSPSPTNSPSATPPSGPTGREMLLVQPSLVNVTAKPGASASVKLTLRAAVALDVTIKSKGLAQAKDGSFISVEPDQDASTFSARSMTSITPDTLKVRPGDAIPLNVTVVVPQNVGDGTRYSILTITGVPSSPGDSSNVGFGVELGVSVIVQVAGTAQTRTGEIKNIVVGNALPGQPLPLTVSLLNTGNTHYGALPNQTITTATLQDPTGSVLATANASGNQISVLPSFTRDIPLSLAPSKPLVDGTKYRIEAGVGLKDGTLLDRKAIEFTWSGGGVLGTPAPLLSPPSAAPVQTPASSSNELLIAVAAALASAAVVALFFIVLWRARRRRPKQDAETDAK